jgi:hypothetical protein
VPHARRSSLISAMKEAGRSPVIAAKKTGSRRILLGGASIDNLDDSSTAVLEARDCEILDAFKAANREVAASRRLATSKLFLSAAILAASAAALTCPPEAEAQVGQHIEKRLQIEAVGGANARSAVQESLVFQGLRVAPRLFIGDTHALGQGRVAGKRCILSPLESHELDDKHGLSHSQPPY